MRAYIRAVVAKRVFDSITFYCIFGAAVFLSYTLSSAAFHLYMSSVCASVSVSVYMLQTSNRINWYIYAFSTVAFFQLPPSTETIHFEISSNEKKKLFWFSLSYGVFESTSKFFLQIIWSFIQKHTIKILLIKRHSNFRVKRCVETEKKNLIEYKLSFWCDVIPFDLESIISWESSEVHFFKYLVDNLILFILVSISVFFYAYWKTFYICVRFQYEMSRNWVFFYWT